MLTDRLHIDECLDCSEIWNASAVLSAGGAFRVFRAYAPARAAQDLGPCLSDCMYPEG